MTGTLDAKDFQSRLQNLDTMLRQAERDADPAARTRLQEIVRAILHLHATGLERLLDHVSEAGKPGQDIFDACAGDDVVSGLLLLHGLHPLELEERISQALESVRPYLRSHGGNVELLEIDEDKVRLKLEGSCHHCPSSTVTMKQTVEEAIYARAPEVLTIEVEGLLEEVSAPEPAGNRLALPVL